MKEITDIVYDTHFSPQVLEDIQMGLRFFRANSIQEFNAEKGQPFDYHNILDRHEVYIIDKVKLSFMTVEGNPVLYSLYEQIGIKCLISDNTDSTIVRLPLDMKQGIYYQTIIEQMEDNLLPLKNIGILYHTDSNEQFIRTINFYDPIELFLNNHDKH